MKIGVNLTEEEAKAFKARKEQELGGGWCVDVYKCQGRWLARAYHQGKHPRGRKPGTKHRSRSEQPVGGTAASANGATNR
jgi:hypothetical protein